MANLNVKGLNFLHRVDISRYFQAENTSSCDPNINKHLEKLKELKVHLKDSRKKCTYLAGLLHCLVCKIKKYTVTKCDIMNSLVCVCV